LRTHIAARDKKITITAIGEFPIVSDPTDDVLVIAISASIDDIHMHRSLKKARSVGTKQVSDD
jgi:hypothetical protein